MFNENFSFGSPPSPASFAAQVEECTSAEISPFTSRCSSPLQQHRPRTPASRRDTRFDTYRNSATAAHQRPSSINALAAQLQSQALNDTEMRSPSPPPTDISSPADSTPGTDIDEGFYDGPDTPATAVSEDDGDETNDDVDPTWWDLSMSDAMVATSSPRPSLSLEAQALSSYTMRRRQRQALVRLQCLVSRAPDLAMLIEECHPSSLPFETDMTSGLGTRARSGSTCNIPGLGFSDATNNGRIEKNRHGSIVTVRKAPRMRKRTIQ